MPENDKIRTEIETGQNIAVNIRRLASKGKESVKYIIGEILKKHDAKDLLDEIFVTVTELVFNAIKANYKYIITLDALEHLVKKTNAAHTTTQIMQNKTLYNAYIKKLDMNLINGQVRRMFKQEEEAGKIITKAQEEGRELNETEKSEIKNKMKMMLRAQQKGIKIYLNFNFEENDVIIDIVNDAPITEEALERIKEKRETFAEYYKQGKEQDFFIENLDTAESAGLGLAMIDSRLYKQGIEPLKSFNIFGIGNKTCLTLTYPLKT